MTVTAPTDFLMPSEHATAPAPAPAQEPTAHTPLPRDDDQDGNTVVAHATGAKR